MGRRRGSRCCASSASLYVSWATRARSTAADVARRPIAKRSTAHVLDVGRSASRREAMSNEQRTPRNVGRSAPKLVTLLAPFSDEEIASGVPTHMPSKQSGGAPRSPSMTCSERSGSGAPRGPPFGSQRTHGRVPGHGPRGLRLAVWNRADRESYRTRSRIRRSRGWSSRGTALDRPQVPRRASDVWDEQAEVAVAKPQQGELQVEGGAPEPCPVQRRLVEVVVLVEVGREQRLPKTCNKAAMSTARSPMPAVPKSITAASRRSLGSTSRWELARSPYTSVG